MTKSNPTIKAEILRSAFYLLLLLSVCAIPLALAQWSLDGGTTSMMPSKQTQKTLTFADRVAYQHAIEEVYWRHRIWPKERPDAKPPLDAVMNQSQLEKKIADYLRDSRALEDYWQRPITAEQLQAEMDRIAQHTKQPEVLRELFEALGNDPFVIAECLARPVLTGRLTAGLSALHQTGRPESLRSTERQRPRKVAAIDSIAKAVQVNRPYHLPIIASSPGGCIDDTWTATSTINAPDARAFHAAVWTGSEMIVWGGSNGGNLVNTGGRYNPSTDSWTVTGITNAPSARYQHTAVWTGSEMIVWGGDAGGGNYLNTGGRYNPNTDSWTATSTTNAPVAREFHTAVWTGSEMIIWGGFDASEFLNTGGRYNPNTNSWSATSTTNAPAGRESHTAVWTPNSMIIWGGFFFDGNNNYLNTGGRYSPDTNSWTATSTMNAPAGRDLHTAVWTGSEMIVWGGFNLSGYFNTGGRYNPSTDNWTATSTTSAPDARVAHTAVWTGNEMVVWGGADNFGNYLNTGGRYDPGADSWTATSTINAPRARAQHTAVSTNSEMIVWGGADINTFLNTGGRYCTQPASTPTPTPTATPCTSRCTPTPRPRPTPAPRPSP